MDSVTAGSALVVASVVGLLAVAIIALRRRSEEALAARESPFAASTEGSRLCPRCAGDNLWTEARCIHCGAKLS